MATVLQLVGDQARRLANAVRHAEMADLSSERRGIRSSGSTSASGILCRIVEAGANDWEYHVHEVYADTLEDVDGGLQVDALNTEELGNTNVTHAILQGTSAELPDRYVIVYEAKVAESDAKYIFSSYPGPLETTYRARVTSLTPAGCVCELTWDQMHGPAVIETPATLPVCEEK